MLYKKLHNSKAKNLNENTQILTSSFLPSYSVVHFKSFTDFWEAQNTFLPFLEEPKETKMMKSKLEQ